MLSESNINVREKLVGFLGSDANAYDITDRQKEAIEKLLMLPNLKFFELCDDVVNEVNNRTGEENVDRSRVMFERLSKLNKEKFKNLVIDVLLVYNYRQAEDAQSSNVGKKIDEKEVKKVLNELNNAYSADNFKELVKNLGFYNKIQEYIKYSRKYLRDEGIADYIKSEIDLEIKNQSMIFLETVSYPEKLFNLVPDNEETNKFKENLCKITDEEIFRKEYGRFLEYLTRKVVPVKQVIIFDSEIDTFCKVLQMILNYKAENIDLEEIKRTELLPVVDSVLNKTKDVETEALNRLKMHRFLIEGISNVGSKNEALQLIVEVAKNVQEIVLNIK